MHHNPLDEINIILSTPLLLYSIVSNRGKCQIGNPDRNETGLAGSHHCYNLPISIKVHRLIILLREGEGCKGALLDSAADATSG